MNYKPAQTPSPIREKIVVVALKELKIDRFHNLKETFPDNKTVTSSKTILETSFKVGVPICTYLKMHSCSTGALFCCNLGNIFHIYEQCRIENSHTNTKTEDKFSTTVPRRVDNFHWLPFNKDTININDALNNPQVSLATEFFLIKLARQSIY